jgi:hypothetical protein
MYAGPKRFSRIALAIVAVALVVSSTLTSTVAVAQSYGTTVGPAGSSGSSNNNGSNSSYSSGGGSSGSIAVWVPSKMLTGEKYQGVVTVTDVEGFDRDVLLVSDNPGSVKVPERVAIKANMHQAVFDIQVAAGPLSRSSVTASVSAVMSGGLVSKATATVYDASAIDSGNSVRLLAFSKTALSFVRVVVVMPDSGSGNSGGGNSNSNSNNNKEVALVYPGGMSKVTIDGNTGYGIADIPLVDGDNRISVFGRLGDTITVTRVPVDPAITVKVSSLHTIPAWTPEWDYQTSWVLVDAERSGKPVRGGGGGVSGFTITATSSNPGVIEVEKSGTMMQCDLPCAIPIHGVSEGNAQVGVYIPGIGGGTTADIATVMPLRHGAGGTDVANLAGKYIQRIIGPSKTFTIDGGGSSVALMSYSSEKAVSSDVTDGPVYGLVGHYAMLYANYTVTSLTGNSTSGATTGQLSVKVPLVVPGASYYMSPFMSGGPVQAEWSGFDGLLKGDIRQQRSDVLTGGMPGTTVKTVPVGIGSSYAAMSTFDVRLNDRVGRAEQKGELTAVALDGSDIRLAGYVTPADGLLRGYAADVIGGGSGSSGSNSNTSNSKGVFNSLLYVPQLPASSSSQSSTATTQATTQQQQQQQQSMGGNGAGGAPTGQGAPSSPPQPQLPAPLLPGLQGQGLPIQQQQQQQQQSQSSQAMAKMEVEVPPLSYPAEGFVFVAHIVSQQGGVPMMKVSPLYELGRGSAGMAGKAQEIDSVFIYDRYVETVKTQVVMNSIDVHVDWPGVLKLGRQVNMTVVVPGVEGAKVSVSGDVRGIPVVDAATAMDGGNGNGNGTGVGPVTGTVTTMALYAMGTEGDRNVVVSVSKLGWMTATASKVIPAKRYETLEIVATSPVVNGTTGNTVNVPIHVPFTLTYSTIDDNNNNNNSGGLAGGTAATTTGTAQTSLPNPPATAATTTAAATATGQSHGQKTLTGTTPYVLDERPIVSRSVTFGSVSSPAENGGARYAYTGRSEDAGNRITGIYERQVQLAVEGGSGSGYYSAGQQVPIAAGPDRQVLGFAVVDRFSHWEYDRNSVYLSDQRARSTQAIIIATTAATTTATTGDMATAAVMIRAVYSADYTVLAVMVVSTAIAIGAYAYRSEIRTMIDTYRRKERESG